MRIGSLFSGIGGLELGLEWAGVGHTVFQVERDPFCLQVLAKHWPQVTRFHDVRSVGRGTLPEVDVLCGGFPCQDVSSAGKGAGLAGARSGLWYEYLRIVDETRPRFVVVENVASGTRRWLPQVREGLESLGYGVRAYALSAADIGAPHLRRRVFVVADSERVLLREQSGRSGGASGQGAAVSSDDGAPWGRDAVPAFRRMDDGVSRRLDGRRLKALGNAVVPQCAAVIGQILVEVANGL